MTHTQTPAPASSAFLCVSCSLLSPSTPPALSPMLSLSWDGDSQTHWLHESQFEQLQGWEGGEAIIDTELDHSSDDSFLPVGGSL